MNCGDCEFFAPNRYREPKGLFGSCGIQLPPWLNYLEIPEASNGVRSDDGCDLGRAAAKPATPEKEGET
jgi:hypothetical protein